MATISQTFRCVDAVARRGSIRQAAEALHLTPAAVHQQIVKFEEQVGTPIFDRLPRGMQLTVAGEIMVAALRRSQRDFDSALAQVADLRTLRRGHVSVAVSHSSAEAVVPDVIEQVMRSYPGVTYTVLSGSGHEILQWVANGEVDIGYCLRRPLPAGVEEIRAYRQQFGLVTSPGHPLLMRHRPLRLRDCLDEPQLFMSPDTELRKFVEQLAARGKTALRPLVETSSVALARRLVASGIGVSFLLLENVAADVARGRLAWTPLADAGAHSYSGLYQRTGQTISVATGMFIQFLDASLTAIERQY